MLADGDTVTEISKELGLAPVTVKHIFHMIRFKLGAKNNINAVALAYHWDLLKVKGNGRYGA